LTVSCQDCGTDQDIVIQSQGADSLVSVESPAQVALVFETADATNVFEFSSPSQSLLELRSGDQPVFQIDADLNGTDVKFFIPLVTINSNLELTGSSVSSRNGSLTFMPVRDKNLVFSPTKGGKVFVDCPCKLETSLKVGLPAETYIFNARDEGGATGQSQRLVTIGTPADPASLRVWGQTNCTPDKFQSNKLQVIGDLMISNGNMMLGNSDVVCGTQLQPGDLGVGGDTIFGNSSDNNVQIKSTVRFSNGSQQLQTILSPGGIQGIDPPGVKGSVFTEGHLIVDSDAQLQSSVILGSDLSHTVTVSALSTRCLDFNASGSTWLGDDDDQNVTVYGNLTTSDSNGTLVFSVGGSNGNCFAGTDLLVKKEISISGCVTIGRRCITSECLSSNKTVVRPDTFRSDVEACFFAPVHMDQNLTVDGTSTFSRLDAAAYTMSDNLLVFDGYNTLATVDHGSGDTNVYASLQLDAGAKFDSNVTLSSPGYTVRAHGAIKTHATLFVEGPIKTEADMSVDGDVFLHGEVAVAGDAQVTGDTYLGLSKDQIHSIYGDLLILGKDAEGFETSLLKISTADYSIFSNGSLTVQGTSGLLEQTTVQAGATVNGRSAFGANLQVDADGQFARDIFMHGAVGIDLQMRVDGNTTVQGDVILGSPGNSIEVAGSLQIDDGGVGGGSILTVDPYIGVHVVGALVISKVVTLRDTTAIGSTAADNLQIYATTRTSSAVVATKSMQISDDITVTGLFQAESSLATKADVSLGRSLGIAAKIKGDLFVEDISSTPILSVSKADGSLVMTGKVTIQGDVTIGGVMNSPRFSAEEIIVDEVKQIASDGGLTKGVTVEGALFRDGAIEVVKVGEMIELLPEHGVTMEDMNSKGGAIVLRSSLDGDSPRGDLRIIQLTNENHSPVMANVSTGIIFEQYYHHTGGDHAAAPSAQLLSRTVGNWNADYTSQNAVFEFQTTYHGALQTRLRLNSDGDMELNSDKVQMDSEFGDLRIQGDVVVGGAAGPQNRSLTLISESQSSTLLLQSGGTSDSYLLFDQLDKDVQFTLRNYALSEDYPTMVLSDNSVDIMKVNDRGNLWVSGTITVGELDSVGVQSLSTQTSGPTTISAIAGVSSDASLVLTSGPNQQAKLQLVDPADSIEGSTIEIFNDGGANNATMRITNGVENLVSVGDQGSVGSLTLEGNLKIFSLDASPRSLTVASELNAEIKLTSGYNFQGSNEGNIGKDAICTLTAGYNQDAMVIFTDPIGFDISSPAFDPKNIFWLTIRGDTSPFRHSTNWAEIGLEEEYHPMLMFDQGFGEVRYNMLAIDDVGAMANLRSTGSGEFGSDKTVVPVTFRMQSGASASAALVAGPASDATLTLHSGSGALAQLQLGVLVNADGDSQSPTTTPTHSTFEIFNIAKPAHDQVEVAQWPDSLWLSDKPTLRTTFNGADDPLAHGVKIMQIVDQGVSGDLALSGDGRIFGNLGGGSRTVSATSSQNKATLTVNSGDDNDAVVLIQAAPNLSPAVILEDVSEAHLATFVMLNDGIQDANPVLKIEDAAKAVLLSLIDRGETGDLEISGNAIFGQSDIRMDRSLRISSTQAANASVQSGPGSPSDMKLVAGPRSSSSLVLSTLTGNASYSRLDRPPSFSLLRNSSKPVNTFEIEYTGEELLRIEDVGSTGDLYVSGDGIVGSKSTDSRKLSVFSERTSMLHIEAGDFSDATFELVAGPDQSAQLIFETLTPMGSDSFVLLLVAQDNNVLPALTLNDADGYAMLNVVDAGVTGDATISGNARFGQTLEEQTTADPRDTQLVVAAGQQASMQVIAETDTASIFVTGGYNAHSSKLRMSTHPEVLQSLVPKESPCELADPNGNSNEAKCPTAYEYYELTNVGPKIELKNSASENTTVLELQDLGVAGKMAFSGDALFSTVGQLTALNEPVPMILSVESGALAEVRVDAGDKSEAELRLQSGVNRRAEFAVSSTAVPDFVGQDPTYETFKFVNDGTLVKPELHITDGNNKLVSVQNTGSTADFTVYGSLSCSDAVSQDRTEFGVDSSSAITILGHITSAVICAADPARTCSRLLFDSDRNGIKLGLEFEDPAALSTIVIPDESGVVLTSVSSFSDLTNVGLLASGSIEEGFGSIITAESISTSTNMASAGTATANSNFIAKATVQFGDEAEDDVVIRGVMQRSMRFSAEKGVRFMSEDGTKTTKFMAVFNDNPLDSPSEAGARQIIIPDVPTGGALHIVFISPDGDRAANNVHQVAIDATAGVVESYMTDLAPGEKNTIQLVNKRIKTDSVVIATIGCDGYRLCPGASTSGGWVLVVAVKVNNLDGGAAIVIRNVHPTQTMVSSFSINFAVFNSD
jgi:hypothetical protein